MELFEAGRRHAKLTKLNYWKRKANKFQEKKIIEKKRKNRKKREKIVENKTNTPAKNLSNQKQMLVINKREVEEEKGGW